MQTIPLLTEIIESPRPDPADQTAQIFQHVIPAAGYTSDLLSCVMATPSARDLGHPPGARQYRGRGGPAGPVRGDHHRRRHARPGNALQKANQEGIMLFSTAKPSFYVVGKLWEMGLRAE